MKLTMFWQKHERLLLAVSGGIDSMVLLHLFVTLPKSIRPVIYVVSINHGMREGAKRDVQFVRDYCQMVDIPFFTNEVVPTVLKSERDAREYRYAFFKKLVKELQCSYVVTAHHGNDQLETILQKLGRGSSLDGICGLLERRVFTEDCQLVRPILAYAKSDIIQYATDNHIAYVQDETNEQSLYLRNRLRQQVVPLLKAEYPRLIEHICDFSNDLVDVLSVVKPKVVQKLKSLQIGSGLSKQRLLAEERAMQRLILAEWLVQQGCLDRQLHAKIFQLLSINDGEKRVTVSKDKVCLISYDSLQIMTSEKVTYAKSYVLDKPTQLDDISLELSVENNANTICGVTSTQLPLIVRTRKAGDKIKLSQYAKKMSRVFIDEKIPLHERDGIYLVEDSFGEIVAILHPRLLHLCKQQETDTIKEYYLNDRKRENDDS